MSRYFLMLFILVIFLTLFVGACSDDDDSDSKTDDDTQEDDDDSDDHDLDAISSASPGRESAILSDSHSGWENADCFACHDDMHRNAFAPGECATCHGSNGAPPRSIGHHSSGCADCHGNKHTDIGFIADNHCTSCHKYEPYEDCPAVEDYDVVVIGAGGGGLSAAAALALEGLSVVVLEKHYKVGGYMSTFHRDGYNFEQSLHAFNGIGKPETAGKLVRLGIYDDLEVVSADPFYISYFPEETYTVPADIEEYKDYLKTKFPHEALGIDDLFLEMASVNEKLSAVLRIKDGFNMDDLLILLADPAATLRLLLYMEMTVEEFMSQYITDKKLKGVWAQLVTFVGLGPSEVQSLFFLSMWNSYHNLGYFYVKGGSRSITQAMADVIEKNGGVIKLNTLVTKIDIKDGLATRVRTENNGCYTAKYVISNANALDTLNKMVGSEHLPTNYTAELNNMEIAVATIQIFMGVDHDYTEEFMGTHELMVNETYDADESYQYCFNGLPELTPIIIANYSVVDETAAPEGKNTIVTTTYLPYDWDNTWQWDIGYAPYLESKEAAAMIYIDRVEELLPGISNHIEVLEVGTPITNYAYTLNPRGSIYGFSNRPSQATLRRLPQQTPIDNLLLAGAWTFVGGGQSSVIGSGIDAADMVLEKEGKTRR